MSEKKVGKRLLTWVLVLVMTLSLLPLNVLAAEADEAAALQMSDEDNSDDRSLMPAKDTTYTITFDAKGGNLNNGNETFDATYNTDNTQVKSKDVTNSEILDDPPSNPPYVFQGWFYEQFNIGIEKEFKPQSTKVKDVVGPISHSGTIYAKWELPDGFEKASIFYLKDPTMRLSSNESEDWRGPLGGEKAGFVNIANLSSWEETKTLGAWGYVENCFTVSTTDVTWPTGFGTPSADGLELNKNTDEWNDIFEAFKTKVEADNGGISLTKDEVDSITLVPYKVSRYNSTGGSYHVDCDVVIKCNFITVDFMVKNDSNVFASILEDGKMTCPKGQAFPQDKVPAAPEKDGYEFDGWYTDGDVKADFDKPLTKDTVFYGKYTEKETPNPEPDNPELGVNFKYDKNIVDVICETTNNHNCSYGLMNGYYTVSDKNQLTNGNWKCTITIDLAKYFDLYKSQHSGHTRDMEHSSATSIMTISPTWYAYSGQWSCAESLIDAANIYVKCDATPTEYIPVTLTANSKTVTYNGEEQTVTDYTSNAPEGVTFEGITATGSGTNAGEYTVNFSDGAVGTTDTTGKYIVTAANPGKLTINKCLVTITAENVTTVYDGKSPVVKDYTILREVSNGDPVNTLPTDHKIASYVTYGSGVDAGEYEWFSMDGAKIVDKNGEDVTSNYQISYDSGTLTITKRSVTLTSETANKVYDGTPLTKPEVTVTGDGFVTGEVTDIKATGTITDVGEVTNTITYNEGANFKADNYEITTTEGKLTITKRPVTLTSASDKKVYDGTALTNGTVNVGGDGFVEGEGATYNVTGTITNVGEANNTFTYTLNKGTKAENYEITEELGTLKVTPITDKVTVTIKGNTKTVYYNGKEQSVKGYTVSIDNNLYKEADFALKNDAKAEAKGTKVGTYPMGLTKESFENTNKNFTNVVFVVNDGYLEITRSGGHHPRPKPTVEIEDDDALGLNTTDHFAYIVGYGNGEVRPQNNITRAEVATIFFRLLTDDVRDENLTKTNRYSDVTRADWYNTAVSTLSSMGIITGYPDGTFRPNAAITRAEFAAIAARFDSNGDKTTAKFSDIATHWAKDEISIAYNNGWINGYPNGTFGPQRDITRAETMTLVNRVLNRQPETEDDLLPNMTVWTDNANPNAWYYLAVQEATNSHYYKFKTNSKYEKWTELRETRDWTQLEK